MQPTSQPTNTTSKVRVQSELLLLLLLLVPLLPVSVTVMFVCFYALIRSAYCVYMPRRYTSFAGPACQLVGGVLAFSQPTGIRARSLGDSKAGWHPS